MPTTINKTKTVRAETQARQETDLPMGLKFSADLNQLIRECEERAARRAREELEKTKPNNARAPYGFD